MNDGKICETVKLRIFDTLNMEIKTTFVRHCPNAFGVSFIHKDGYKITYSGDTMPSDNLVNLGNYMYILFFYFSRFI